jgi:hypothetical protein
MFNSQPEINSISATTLNHSKPVPLLPQQQTEADCAAKYWCDVLGLPFPLNVWLATCLSENTGGPGLDNKALYSALSSVNPFVVNSAECKVWVHQAEVHFSFLLGLCIKLFVYGNIDTPFKALTLIPSISKFLCHILLAFSYITC